MVYRVNLDFDIALQKNNPKLINDKYNTEFEYIYFLVHSDHSTLKNCTDYSEDYIQYIKSKGFVIPDFSNSKTFKNWWGDTDEFTLAKKLDSKVNCVELSNKYNLSLEGVKVVRNEDDFKKYIDSSDEEVFYYRSEFGFSGNGNKVIKAGGKYTLRYPGVISRFLDVVMTFGITVDLSNFEFFIVKNYIGKRGEFLGGEIIHASELASLFSISEGDLIAEIESLFMVMKKELGEVQLQFDSLIYRDGDEMRWYKLVEINYRKTMGLVVKSLTDKLGPGSWKLTKNIYKNICINQVEKELKEKEGADVVVTSPSHCHFLSYYVIS